jgi:hypothetical protein
MKTGLRLIGMAVGLFAAEASLADVRPEQLILHYTFDSDERWIAEDESGNGNHGRIVGAAAIAGLSGQGIQLDGRTSFIRTPSNGALMPEEISLSVRFQLDKLPDVSDTLLFKRNKALHNHESYVLEIMPTGVARFALGNGMWQTRLDSQTLLEPGRWHHVVATFRQPEMRVYVDGTLSATGIWDQPMQHNPESDLFVGVRDHLVHPLFVFAAVKLDEVRIYNCALAPEEVSELAGLIEEQGKLWEESGWFGADNPNGAELFLDVAEDGDGGRVLVQWDCQPGELFDLYWTDDLNKGFVCIASGLASDGYSLSFRHLTSSDRTGFYWVMRQP